ncbi:MAG: tetraacyldisaccharide 4'-kinase [Rickettsiaceae bacterium]|nr:tetraacyldisaccharide 4'-kinase [Rickettsiaceae bacterium]
MIKLVYPKFWSKKGWLSCLCTPFSYIYRILGMIRKLFVRPLGINSFVICVGNVSVGGTGKTQLVLWLSRQLNKKKAKYLIVTKAYGSSLKGAKIVEKGDLASRVGDESILLSEVGPVLASKTVKDALPIINQIKPDIVIFDDGFQNPSFIKDFSILVFDAVRAIGNGKIFPAGPLREYVKSALSRSDIVVSIGDEATEDSVLQRALDEGGKEVYEAKIKLTQDINLKQKYFAFTAIGNPDRFYNLLRQNGVQVQDVRSFPDHHNYSNAEIDDLKNCSKQLGYSLITTRKDYVKILDKETIMCADVALEFEDETKLFEKIYEKI